MTRSKLMQDRQLEIALGIALFLTSTYLIYDAYEGRGQKRPFLARFLP